MSTLKIASSVLYNQVTSVALTLIMGMVSMGCGDSSTSKIQPPSVVVTSVTALNGTAPVATTVDATQDAVLAKLTYDNHNVDDIVLGGTKVRTNPQVQSMYLTTVSSAGNDSGGFRHIVVGVGTLQHDGSWLITPVGGAKQLAFIKKGTSGGLTLRADLTNLANIGVTHEVTVESIHILPSNLTLRTEEGQNVLVNRVIPAIPAIPGKIIILPPADGLPIAVNQIPFGTHGPGIPSRP